MALILLINFHPARLHRGGDPASSATRPAEIAVPYHVLVPLRLFV